MPRARAAALHALEIDPASAAAHASLGMVKMRFDWDLAGAQSSFKRALQLNHSYGPAHQWQGECFAGMGKVDEAIASLERAMEFDPLSLTVNAVLGGMFYFARKYGSAIAQCRRTLEVDPAFWPALKFLGLSQLQQGEVSVAIDILRAGVEASGRNSIMLATLGNAYAAAGMRDKAYELLDAVKPVGDGKYVPSLCSAFIQIGLGCKDAAFTELENAFKERSGWLVFLRVDPRFDLLRDDPRYSSLIASMGSGFSKLAA